MDNSLKPVEDFIQSGVAERFYRIFNTPILFYNGPDVKKVANEMLVKPTRPHLYPFAVAKFVSFAINEQSYKANTLMRRGLHSRASHDQVLAYELNLIPVTTTFEINVYIQDMKSVKDFAKKWMFTSVRNNLCHSITYAVADLDINVKLDRTLNIPQREGGVTEIKEYMLTSNMTITGYMSEDLKTVQAVTDVQTEAQLGALTENGARVFMYDNPWTNVGGVADSTNDNFEEGPG